MTKEGLEKFRFITPIVIASAAATPAVFNLNLGDKALDNWLKYLVPLSGGIIGALYSFFGIRLKHWRREMEDYVGKQIRTAFISMLPENLAVTPEEKLELFEKAVWRKLTGVFWETIDGDAYLISLKPHFYANGAFYTGAIDGYIIMTFFSLVYLILWFAGFGIIHLFFSAICILLALVSRFVLLPMKRKIHLELSSEQLETIRNNRLEYIQDKFREIIQDWREKKRLRMNS
jgi:hypothetical protein